MKLCNKCEENERAKSQTLCLECCQERNRTSRGEKRQKKESLESRIVKLEMAIQGLYDMFEKTLSIEDIQSTLISREKQLDEDNYLYGDKWGE